LRDTALQSVKLIDRLSVPIEIIFDSQGQRLSLLSKLAPEKRVVVGFETDPRQRRAGKLDDRTDGEALNFLAPS